MRKLILLFVLIAGMSHAQSTDFRDEFFTLADQFFGKYVLHGDVKYTRIAKDTELMDILVSLIAGIPLHSFDENEAKAFYINVYNILVIKQVVDHFPVNGPMNIDGFFDKKRFNVAGNKLTLDQLEKKIIFVRFPDPRIHFALVCAAEGCPELPDFAFLPDKLEQQLFEVTKGAMNDPQFLKVNDQQETVYVSKIFEWYRKDFLENHSTIIEYINAYREKKIPENYRMLYYDYSWNLNQA